MPRKDTFHLRLDPALKAALEAEALRQSRSLNNLIEVLLSESIARLTQGDRK